MQGTIVPNQFEPVPVTVGDREALYGGLISAGHPTEYARHQADTLSDTDGALQMLARYRITSTAQAASVHAREAVAEVDRLRAVLVRICEEDRHGRMIKANPQGGFRGRGGMIAAFALTGKNGSHLIDEEIRQHVAAFAAVSVS